jgi:hypothetical protein
MKNRFKLPFLILLLTGVAAFSLTLPASPPAQAQQPTGSVPTVTGTPAGPFITVTNPDAINVRAGPSTYYYPIIGTLFSRQTAPALGRSVSGEWIQIVYTGVPDRVGWVYAPLVSISPGASLPIVEPPPTPTPAVTATINPTLAAAYLPQMTATRLPTFTPAPPLAVPTFLPAEVSTATGGIPPGLIIAIMALVGGFGALISFLRNS